MESCQGSSRERVAPPLIFREQGKTYPITIAPRADNFTISTVTSSPPNLFIFYLRLFIRHTLRAVFIERAVSINNRGVAENNFKCLSLTQLSITRWGKQGRNPDRPLRADRPLRVLEAFYSHLQTRAGGKKASRRESTCMW